MGKRKREEDEESEEERQEEPPKNFIKERDPRGFIKLLFEQKVGDRLEMAERMKHMIVSASQMEMIIARTISIFSMSCCIKVATVALCIVARSVDSAEIHLTIISRTSFKSISNEAACTRYIWITWSIE